MEYNRFTWISNGVSRDNVTGKVTDTNVHKQYRVTDEQGIILFSSNVESNCQTFMDKYSDICFECHLFMDKFNNSSMKYENVTEMTKVTFGMATNTIRYSEV